VRLRNIATALAATTALLLGAVGLSPTAAPAQAAGSCGVTVPSRIVMNAPYKKVPVTYGYDCLDSQADATWQLTHTYHGAEDLFWYDYSAGDDRSDYFELYDWDHLGSYTIDPLGAYSPDYSDVRQNAPVATVKLGTRVALEVTRAGGRAYFRTTTSAYSPARDAFSRYPNAKVAVQYKSCAACAWTTLRTGYTDSAAAWTFNVASTRSSWFRSVLHSGPKTWDAQGPTLYR
jgi:hypothetical protein